MELRRRLRKNKIINEIRDTEVFIDRSNKTIQRIKNSQMGEVYIKNQIIKLKEAIEQKELVLIELNEDIIKISNGLLDNDIDKEYEDSDKKFQDRLLETKKNKVMKKHIKEKKKDMSEKYWKSIISASREHKQKDRDVRYAYKYFSSVNDSLPEYMKTNLVDMPNNKGYVWRGVHFYGKLETQRGPLVMFEKQKGGNILIIHEYTDREYKRYEKKGKDRKYLTYSHIKKHKKHGVDLMDYLVKK